MNVDYDGRVFRSVSNSHGGDVDDRTTFTYRQDGHIVWATYAGGSVLFGTLLAKMNEFGALDMRYQHITVDGAFRSGVCESKPEVLPDGRVRLHERWQWTEGADGRGASVVEEVPMR